jgi:hypothetical protein
MLYINLVSSSQTSFLDRAFGPLFRYGRQKLNEFIAPRNLERSFQINVKDDRIQKQFLDSDNFFCDVNLGKRSQIVPVSVHKLKPGDIDVIAAIGDSLTAANGAFAENELQVLLEARGVSWSIGKFRAKI